MKQRGKKSSNQLSVASEITDYRPKAPDLLSTDEKVIWKRVVNSKPHDWFKGDSFDVLMAYCRNCADASITDNLIKTMPLAELSTDEGFTRLCRLKRLRDMHESRLVQLATKMRLTHQARYTTRAAATADQNAPRRKPWETEASV